MKAAPAIARWRLHNQHIGRATLKSPADVVHSLGAVQAQDYLGSLWAIGLRMRGATEAIVERAIEERSIVRTWPLRGTLHFVAATDVHWMIELLAPRVVAKNARRLKQTFDLDESVYKQSRKLLELALRGGGRMSRPALYAMLDEAGIATANQRGLHILWWHAHEGLICLGPRAGKQQTFVLLDEWVPHGVKLNREQALAELGRRYFLDHGPATAQDFAWWSGLAPADVTAAVEMIEPQLVADEIDGKEYWRASAPMPRKSSQLVHLLPAFDEYTVAYKDRSDVLSAAHASRSESGHGIFFPPIVVDGRIAGTWSRTIKKNSVAVKPKLFGKLGAREMSAFKTAAGRYADFLGLSLADRT